MKIGRILTAIMLTGAFYMAQAHMFWVDGANDEKLGKFIANMGYSDDFLKLEPIMAERVHLFAPITVISKDGNKKKLKQSGEELPLRRRKIRQRHIYLTSTAKSYVFA